VNNAVPVIGLLRTLDISVFLRQYKDDKKKAAKQIVGIYFTKKIQFG